MRSEFVSVIVPAYNVESYIEVCINSIINQTYNNYEIIIIDDGSSDNTYEICKKIRNSNSKIKLHRQENQGVSVARNVGMSLAKGKYYIFVDADDMVSKYYIETLVNAIKHDDMAIIGYTTEINNFSEKCDGKSIEIDAQIVKNKILLNAGYDGYLWNKIFKRKIIEKYQLHFEEEITVWEDMYFILQYLEYCRKIREIKAKLYFYRSRDGSAVKELNIDKYRSKYYIMNKIMNSINCYSIDNKQRIRYLYYETMLSYVNKAFHDKVEIENAYFIIKKTQWKEIIELKNNILFLKFIFLKFRGFILM